MSIGFISMGDWGNPNNNSIKVRRNLNGMEFVTTVSQLVADKIRELTSKDASIQFVIAAGDNFYEKGVQALPQNVNPDLFSKTPTFQGILNRIHQSRLSGLSCSISTPNHGYSGKNHQESSTPHQLHLWSSSLGHTRQQHNDQCFSMADILYADKINNKMYNQSLIPWHLHDPLWAEVYEERHRKSRASAADGSGMVPWYLCLGNHDYRGSPLSQIAFTYVDQTGLWVMPDAYYHVSYVINTMGVKLHLVVIDTYILCCHRFANKYPDKDDRSEYLHGVTRQKKHKAWIRAVLTRIREDDRKSGIPSIIVMVGHFPLYSTGAHCSMNMNRVQTNANIDMHFQKKMTIKKWLVHTCIQYNVSLYISGHNHILEHITVNRTEPGPSQQAGVNRVKNDSAATLECIVSGSASKFDQRSCQRSYQYGPRSPKLSGFLMHAYNYFVNRSRSKQYQEYNISISTAFNKELGYGFVLHRVTSDGSIQHTIYSLDKRWEWTEKICKR